MILVAAVAIVFFRFGGELLVAEDNIEDVDHAVIVLLMGSVADRALGAADLYGQGKADSILMVRSHITGGEELQRRGITIIGDTENSKNVLVESGVVEDDIRILPGDAQSTKDEALAIADYLEDRLDMDTIILVTSKFHSQRAKVIFNKALEDLDVEIYSAPTPYDPFQASGWYNNREDIQRVATEYLKFMHYLFLEQFQMERES